MSEHRARQRSRPTTRATARACITLLAALVTVGAAGCSGGDQSGATEGTADIVEDDVAVAGDSIADVPASRGTDADRRIFEKTMVFARQEQLSGRSISEIMVQVGRTFLGTPYVPHTLEAEGPESLVVNLRELDCVTYVENVLALSRLVRAGDTDFDSFQRELTRIRYREGRLEGYPSRLHYFSEWISDNDSAGLVRDVTREIGGVPDNEPIDFMTTHVDAYSKLSGNPSNVRAVRAIEERLSERVRYYVPEERIAEVAPQIQDGDVIAATSSIEGLDVAHTGLAIWVDGELHLMHAPLVGSEVHISDLTLAERILDIDGQDGIMVARPI